MSQPQQPRFEGIDPDQLPGPWTMGAFMDHLGFRFTLISPDRLEATLVADERHHQPYGIVHGGVYASVVETMASMAAAIRAQQMDGSAVVGVSNTTDFVRAHRHGRLDAVATPIHVGRSQQLWEVVITREDGKLVSRGQVRMQAIPPGREIAGQAVTPATNPPAETEQP